QRKGKNEPVVQNGVSNGYVNGKTSSKASKAKALPVKEDSDSEPEPVKPAKQVNRHGSKKETRKRTSSVTKTATLGERKAVLNAGSSSESKGDSMAFLLTQGLMANDASKVDTVLEKTNPNVIQATLAELPTAEVIPLLKAIEIRLRTRKALDIRPWIRWAQCCLSLHLPYLSSQPSLEASLGGLLDWMRNRTSHMQKLLALHGKMNVFVEEMEKRRGGGSGLNAINTTPIVVFNEDDGKSDEEMDSMSGDEEDGASSEEDWWDDGGVAAAVEEEESDENAEEADSDDANDDDDSDEEGEGVDDDSENDEDEEDSDDAMEV
ncbi:hypothetical protein PFISCL1PPCAC_2057, partial [Pristionchus fissidentatus]